jgi:tetratricopeptide (TPR) repeat protein
MPKPSPTSAAATLFVALAAASLTFFAHGPAARADDFTFEAEEAAAGPPPGETMDKATRFYEGRKYFQACKMFHRVAVDPAAEADEFRPKAEYFLGKCLYNLKLFYPALGWFTKVAAAGKTHPYFKATITFLAALARELPPDSGVLEAIGKYTPEDFPAEKDDVTAELTFLLGRYHYETRNFDIAEGLFAAVPKTSKFYVKAMFFKGMVHVQRNEGKEAGEAFKEILRVTESASSKDEETEKFQELATLSLARVFYATGQYKLAIKYWDKIDSDSIYWLDSLFEESWAHFQTDDYSRALGNIHTLNAPYFDREFYPESLILKALIEFVNCRWTRARATIKSFEDIHKPLRDEMKAFLDKYADPTEFYAFFSKFRTGKVKLSPTIEKMLTIALADKALERSVLYVEELDNELKAIQANEKRWKDSPLYDSMLEELTVAASLAKGEVGAKIKARFAAVGDDLGRLIKDAIRIRIETASAEAGALEAGSKGELVTTKKKTKVVVDDEHVLWPFDGEYWKDELGYYRSEILSACAGAK